MHYFRPKGDSTERREGQKPAGALVSGHCSGLGKEQDQLGLRDFWVRVEFYGAFTPEQAVE